MWNTKYYFKFNSVDNEDFKVEIQTQESATVIELTGGTNPFTVTYDIDNFMFCPTRLSGATIRVVTNKELSDLFSTSYHSHRVVLTKKEGNMYNTKWVGFVTPDVYSQPIDPDYYQLEIECVSALSTLKFIKYDDPIKDRTSLRGLVNKALKLAETNTETCYLPACYALSDISSIYVSNANWYDEKGDTLNWLELLCEVCKFLGMSITEQDGRIFFIDPNYIESGGNHYVPMNGGGEILLNNKGVDINSLDSKGIDNKLTILPGYNKATVIDSDYELDPKDLFPEIKLSAKYAEVDLHYGVDGKKIDKDPATYLLRWYMSSNYPTYNYRHINGDNWNLDTVISKDLAGCHIINHASYKDDDLPIRLNWERMFEIKMRDITDNQLIDNSIEQDYGITDKVKEVDKINNNQLQGYLKPMISNIPMEKGCLVFPNDAYLGVKMSVCCVPSLAEGFRGIPISLSHKEDTVNKIMSGAAYNHQLITDDLGFYYFVPMKLSIGDKFYNGTTWVSDSNAYVKIPLDVEPTTHLEGKWLNVKNNNDFSKGVEDLGECYLIPLNGNLYGQIKVEVMIPCIIARNKEYIYVKDIEFDVARIDKSDNKKEKQDTKYTNVVNDTYLSECEDIEFKITSDNDADICYSKAMTNNQWLDVITNSAIGTQKPEVMLLDRIIREYSRPKRMETFEVKIDDNIKYHNRISDNGKQYMLLGQEIDYEANKSSITMLEFNN